MIKIWRLKAIFATTLLATVSSSCKREILVEPTPTLEIPDSTVSAGLTMAATSKMVSGSILKLGINGHLGDAPYLSVPWKDQIKLLKARGMSYYRINVQTKSDGTASASKDLEALQSAASASGIRLLPMLYPRTLDVKKSESENYTNGKTLGANFAAKYKNYFVYYNLGNDLELPLLNANTTGTKPSHYNLERFKKVAAYVKGMNDGIKSKDSDAKTIVSAGWLHYGWLQMLEDYGVKFDRIGYNWYSDMETGAAKAPYYITDITKKLASLFPDKPIWFVEFNYRYKATSTTNEADQEDFVKKFTAKCAANPQVKVAMVYQLFDEPYKTAHEGNYGIIKWKVKYTSWLEKPLSKLFVSALTN
ncbi:MAG: glycosyl hydrolase 53 family protein [Mucilaginibacter sp.]|nr:glycosyl hydrolase 53 family protein [Mucilaginibacter sp.]